MAYTRQDDTYWIGCTFPVPSVIKRGRTASRPKEVAVGSCKFRRVNLSADGAMLAGGNAVKGSAPVSVTIHPMSCNDTIVMVLSGIPPASR